MPMRRRSGVYMSGFTVIIAPVAAEAHTQADRQTHTGHAQADADAHTDRHRHSSAHTHTHFQHVVAGHLYSRFHTVMYILDWNLEQHPSI